MENADKDPQGDDRVRHLGQAVSEHLTGIGIASLIATFVIPALLLSFLPWAKSHPTIVIFGALNLFALTSIVLLTLRITVRMQKGLLSYKAIVKSCGIEGFHPLKTPQEKKAGWGACVERIAEARRNELCLAVFTGASTFSGELRQGEENPLPPLRKALEDHKGDLRILVMQTGCPAWEQSIQEFGKGDVAEERRFRLELEAAYEGTLKFCDYLARKQAHQLRSIEVRAYDRPPLWKLVIMGNHIWLQHYIQGKRADDLPAYVVRRDVDGGLAYPLESVFQYRWQLSKGRVVVHRDAENKRIV